MIFQKHHKKNFLRHINKLLMEVFSTNVSIENIYFSEHDALRIVIEKNLVDFQMIL